MHLFLNFKTEEVLIQIRKEWYSFLTKSKCSVFIRLNLVSFFFK